jgi:hypothetical protein
VRLLCRKREPRLLLTRRNSETGDDALVLSLAAGATVKEAAQQAGIGERFFKRL